MIIIMLLIISSTFRSGHHQTSSQPAGTIFGWQCSFIFLLSINIPSLPNHVYLTNPDRICGFLCNGHRPCAILLPQTQQKVVLMKDATDQETPMWIEHRYDPNVYHIIKSMVTFSFLSLSP